MGRRSRGHARVTFIVILIDSSAWIEFLRDTGSPACKRVDQLLGTDIAICDPIKMEMLAGARNERQLQDLRGLLALATNLPTLSVDYESAAALYRSCRRNGETVRKMIDCLIASVAIREDTTVLHHDVDFATLARHTALSIEAPN